jgi:CubicO group peptidase (beta-lactamase class C family)
VAAAGLGFGPPDPALPLSPDEWITRFAELPLLDQPGTAWRYEISFAVLGVLLARAADAPLDVLPQTAIPAWGGAGSSTSRAECRPCCRRHRWHVQIQADPREHGRGHRRQAPHARVRRSLLLSTDGIELLKYASAPVRRAA